MSQTYGGYRAWAHAQRSEQLDAVIEKARDLIDAGDHDAAERAVVEGLDAYKRAWACGSGTTAEPDCG